MHACELKKKGEKALVPRLYERDGNSMQAFLLRSTVDLGVERYGGIFFYMKNRRTKRKGYVFSPYVARKGTLECKP